MSRHTLLFSNPNSYATNLIGAYIQMFGADALEWEPETIVRELLDETHLAQIPAMVLDKLQAAMTLLTTNQFYQYSEAFENIGHAFCGDVPDFRILTPLSPEEAAWALIEARIIDPPNNPSDNIFSKEVLGYLRATLDTAGICTPPEIYTSVGVAQGREACSEYPELKEDIETNQKIKQLRIKTYFIHHYKHLSAEMFRIFAQKPPTLPQLLENRTLRQSA